MRNTLALFTIGLLMAAVQAGCRQETPPPARVPVPATETHRIREREPVRPLPAPGREAHHLPPRYEDQPLLIQRPPEQRAFVDAYHQIGRPRITVFVNRTLEGDIIPVWRTDPVAAVEHRRQATDAVTVERREYGTRESRRSYETRQRTDRFESPGPAEYRETTEVYLRPGEYDEIAAKSLDYEAMENILADWLSSNGQVTIISPMMARDRLTDEQLEELQAGRPQVLREIAEQLDADVLIQVQARPTRQTFEGLEVRVIAEAINTRGGESIGRAVVDVPPPLEKRQLNQYTRFLARKLMDDMTDTWYSLLPPEQE